MCSTGAMEWWTQQGQRSKGTGLLPGVGGRRSSHGVQRVWQDTCRGADRALVMHIFVTHLTHQGRGTKMMSSWVGHRYNISKAGRPLVLLQFTFHDILYMTPVVVIYCIPSFIILTCLAVYMNNRHAIILIWELHASFVCINKKAIKSNCFVFFTL